MLACLRPSKKYKSTNNKPLKGEELSNLNQALFEYTHRYGGNKNKIIINAMTNITLNKPLYRGVKNKLNVYEPRSIISFSKSIQTAKGFAGKNGRVLKLQPGTYKALDKFKSYYQGECEVLLAPRKLVVNRYNKDNNTYIIK